MRAGKLRHRVTLRRPKSGKDAPRTPTGAVVEAYDTLGVRWASVEPLRGRERFAAQQVNAEITHRVRLRYMDGIDATVQVLHRGRVLQVVTPMNIEERGRELELLCTERSPDVDGED